MFHIASVTAQSSDHELRTHPSPVQILPVLQENFSCKTGLSTGQTENSPVLQEFFSSETGLSTGSTKDSPVLQAQSFF